MTCKNELELKRSRMKFNCSDATMKIREGSFDNIDDSAPQKTYSSQRVSQPLEKSKYYSLGHKIPHKTTSIAQTIHNQWQLGGDPSNPPTLLE